mgnify:CR=1 FL=1
MIDMEAVGKVLGPNLDAVEKDGGRALKELGLRPGAKVLDVGTGKGTFAIFLALNGFAVTTGEPSTDTSQYARRDWAAKAKEAGVLEKIRFQDFKASEMPFESESFEAVFFFGVLHHIDEAERRDVMREALRVAKVNGAVVFLEPGEEMLGRVRAEDPAHPPAADAGKYLDDKDVREQRIGGMLMDVFIYKKIS